MPTTIDLIYFNAGGGHRAAASALEAVMVEQRRPWTVRCVNLFEVLDPRGQFRHLTGFNPEDIYNKRLAKGWTLGLAQELKVLQGMIRLGHHLLLERLTEHWLRTEPDMAVSLVPNFNRALLESLQATLPGVPFVTVLTDMADHPPNFWIAADQTQHVICGTAKAAAQAREAGCAGDRIHRTSGMIIRPDFYAPLPMNRDAERAALGLDPTRRTGIVMFGGQGSMAMLSIARQLEDVQLILLCGHHQTLFRRLRLMKTSAPHAVVEFTPQVRRYLQLADFFIGKPGPGSLSEAVQMGLPVIVTRNAWTMPQERWNTSWVQTHGLGVVLRSFRHVAAAVDEVQQNLPVMRARLAAMDNRAVFEVPHLLDRLLRGRCSEAQAATATAHAMSPP